MENGSSSSSHFGCVRVEKREWNRWSSATVNCRINIQKYLSVSIDGIFVFSTYMFGIVFRWYAFGRDGYRSISEMPWATFLITCGRCGYCANSSVGDNDKRYTQFQSGRMVFSRRRVFSQVFQPMRHNCVEWISISFQWNRPPAVRMCKSRVRICIFKCYLLLEYVL